LPRPAAVGFKKKRFTQGFYRLTAALNTHCATDRPRQWSPACVRTQARQETTRRLPVVVLMGTSGVQDTKQTLGQLGLPLLPLRVQVPSAGRLSPLAGRHEHSHTLCEPDPPH